MKVENNNVILSEQSVIKEFYHPFSMNITDNKSESQSRRHKVEEWLKNKSVDEILESIEELADQNDEKEKRAAELVITNRELAFQNEEKAKLVKELGFEISK